MKITAHSSCSMQVYFSLYNLTYLSGWPSLILPVDVIRADKAHLIILLFRNFVQLHWKSFDTNSQPHCDNVLQNFLYSCISMHLLLFLVLIVKTFCLLFQEQRQQREVLYGAKFLCCFRHLSLISMGGSRVGCS